jgi:short-subunit dehydrogenase
VSSGFGRIMTEQLLARGDRVAGTVRNLSVMDDLTAKYHDRSWLADLEKRGFRRRDWTKEIVDFHRALSISDPLTSIYLII